MGNKPALDPEPFLCDFLPAVIAYLLIPCLHPSLFKIALDPSSPVGFDLNLRLVHDFKSFQVLIGILDI
jgi:hypothetical protein